MGGITLMPSKHKTTEKFEKTGAFTVAFGTADTAAVRLFGLVKTEQGVRKRPRLKRRSRESSVASLFMRLSLRRPSPKRTGCCCSRCRAYVATIRKTKKYPPSPAKAYILSWPEEEALNCIKLAAYTSAQRSFGYFLEGAMVDVSKISRKRCALLLALMVTG